MRQAVEKARSVERSVQARSHEEGRPVLPGEAVVDAARVIVAAAAPSGRSFREQVLRRYDGRSALVAAVRAYDAGRGASLMCASGDKSGNRLRTMPPRDISPGVYHLLMRSERCRMVRQ